MQDRFIYIGDESGTEFELVALTDVPNVRVRTKSSDIGTLVGKYIWMHTQTEGVKVTLSASNTGSDDGRMFYIDGGSLGNAVAGFRMDDFILDGLNRSTSYGHIFIHDIAPVDTQLHRLRFINGANHGLSLKGEAPPVNYVYLYNCISVGNGGEGFRIKHGGAYFYNCGAYKNVDDGFSTDNADLSYGYYYNCVGMGNGGEDFVERSLHQYIYKFNCVSSDDTASSTLQYGHATGQHEATNCVDNKSDYTTYYIDWANNDFRITAYSDAASMWGIVSYPVDRPPRDYTYHPRAHFDVGPFEFTEGDIPTYDDSDILGQDGDSIIINAGSAFDALGNHLDISERAVVLLDFSAGGFPTDENGTYGFLCMRRRDTNDYIDYMENPVTGQTKSTKLLNVIEFYLSTSIVTIEDGIYFPPLREGVIDGVVLAKVYEDAADPPDPSFRTILATKDGSPLDIPGFTGITE